MVPQRIVVHAELPRIGSGKIDRRTLAGSPPAAE
jgi:acyl-coenzyme A synthetase/AMP-(fatty) acid ligase